MLRMRYRRLLCHLLALGVFTAFTHAEADGPFTRETGKHVLFLI